MREELGAEVPELGGGEAEYGGGGFVAEGAAGVLVVRLGG